MNRAWISALGLMALISGCAVTRQSVDVDYYELSYAAPEASTRPLQDVVLGVRRFGIASAYDHDRLVQIQKDSRTYTSYYHRWTSNPRMMLPDVLLRDLIATGTYKAVVMLPSDLLPDYEINGYVQTVSVNMTDGKPKAKLALDITLLTGERKKDVSRIVFQKNYTAEIPAAGDKAPQVVEAFGKAMQQISEQIRNDVYDAVLKAGAPAQSSEATAS